MLVLMFGLVLAGGQPTEWDDAPFRTAQFSVGQGLSQGSVYTISIDARGFLWAGTHDGVNRFDGHTFATYRHDGEDATSRNRVVALLSEADGTVWVLSHGSLDRLEPTTGRLTPSGVRAPPGEQFATLHVERGGTLWLGSSRRLYSADPEAGTLTPRAEGINVRSLVDDGTTLWMATHEGLWKHSDATLTQPTGLTGELRDGNLNAILIDRMGSLWVGGELGAYRRPSTSDSFELIALDHAAASLAEDAAGRIWAGSPSGGLSVIEPDSRIASRIHLNGLSDRVQSIEGDESGIVWVGTDGAGLVRVDPRPRKFGLVRFGTPGSQDAFIRSVHEALGGDLWVGTLNGLHRRYSHSDTWESIDPSSLPHHDVRAIATTSDDITWIGTAAGLARWTGRSEFIPVNLIEGETQPGINVLTADPEGHLWAGTDRGLFFLDSHGQVVAAPIPTGTSRDVRAASIDSEGSLWWGNYQGDVFNLPGGVIGSRAAHRHLSLGATVADIAVDRNGRIWIGTWAGLYRYEAAGGVLRHFTEADGLPSSFVYFILEDSAGHLWSGTNRGLVRFDPSADLPTFRVYTPEDGLQSYEFNSRAAHRGPSGTLYAGGIEGLNVFTPASIADRLLPPRVAFTGLKRFDEPIDPGFDLNAGRQLRLDWRRDRVFSIGFAGLDLGDPARLQYAYQMTGIDPDWVYASNRREARYTNLPPGTYLFSVRAANADGVWTDEPRTLSIYVPAPFWRTWWFLSIALMVVAGGLASGARGLAVRKMRRQLEEVERLRALDAAVHDERERIAADVHDHVGATLTQIQLLSELARRGKNGAGDQLDQIASTARAATQDLDAIVWAVNPAHDHLEAFTDYLYAYALEFTETAGLRCRFEQTGITDVGVLPAEVRYAVFLTAKEALHNIAKHATASEVRLRIAAEEMEAWTVEIEDDGCGFEERRDPFGNGLDSMRRRVAAVGGSFDIRSACGLGTAITVTIPMKAVSARASESPL